jgi:tellurite resistance protein TehA-like permease
MMTPSSGPTVEQVEREEHEMERSSHAIYGLIIITSSLVADRAAAEDAATSLLVLWGAGIVLILAHLYSAVVAEVGEKGRWLSHTERHVLITDNVPVLAAVVVPSLLLVAAGTGRLELGVALDVAIVLSMVALFVVGIYQARRHGASSAVQVGLGTLGGLIGVIVILMEWLLAH